MRSDIDGVPGVTQIGWDLTVLGVAFVQTCGTVCSAPAESLVAPLGRIADELSALFTVQYRRPSGDDRHAGQCGGRPGASPFRGRLSWRGGLGDLRSAGTRPPRSV